MTKLFPRTRASLRRLGWRLGFAGRIMERTTWQFKRAYDAAAKTQEVYPDWEKLHPKTLADRHVKLFVPEAERTAWGKRHDKQ